MIKMYQEENLKASDFIVQQWLYLPTADYGGPKKNLQLMKITNVNISEDRKRVCLEMPGLKNNHIILFPVA